MLMKRGWWWQWSESSFESLAGQENAPMSGGNEGDDDVDNVVDADDVGVDDDWHETKH